MVEMVGVCQVMWFVMLESPKDRVIGVDTPGQQVPPRVRYEMACLLIRDDVGSVPCLMSGNLALLLTQAHTVQEELWYRDYPGKP
jgi:hypothetical protein